jgi:hypothetical protein
MQVPVYYHHIRSCKMDRQGGTRLLSGPGDRLGLLSKLRIWSPIKPLVNFHKCFISCTAECPDNISISLVSFGFHWYIQVKEPSVNFVYVHPWLLSFRPRNENLNLLFVFILQMEIDWNWKESCVKLFSGSKIIQKDENKIQEEVILHQSWLWKVINVCFS